MVKFTIQEFNQLFNTEKKCLEAILKINGFKCDRCGESNYFLNSKKRIVCKNCLKARSALKGTIFYHSKIDLRLWFYAIFLFSNSKNGVSAKQLERDTGLSYSTCFYMLHKIRAIMKDKRKKKLSGTIEVDETFIGGKAKNRAWRFYSKSDTRKKDIVFGMMERGGRVVVQSIPDTKKSTLMKAISKNVEKGSTVYSDELGSYKPLSENGYEHDFIRHKIRHVRGDVHTQNIEGFWGQFKRAVLGVYKKVSSKYIENYAWESAFRYNHRSLGGQVFYILLNRSVRPS